MRLLEASGRAPQRKGTRPVPRRSQSSKLRRVFLIIMIIIRFQFQVDFSVRWGSRVNEDKTENKSNSQRFKKEPTSRYDVAASCDMGTRRQRGHGENYLLRPPCSRRKGLSREFMHPPSGSGNARLLRQVVCFSGVGQARLPRLWVPCSSLVALAQLWMLRRGFLRHVSE